MGGQACFLTGWGWHGLAVSCWVQQWHFGQWHKEPARTLSQAAQRLLCKQLPGLVSCKYSGISSHDIVFVNPTLALHHITASSPTGRTLHKLSFISSDSYMPFPFLHFCSGSTMIMGSDWAPTDTLTFWAGVPMSLVRPLLNFTSKWIQNLESKA